MSPQELRGWDYRSTANGTADGTGSHIHYLIVDDVDQIPDGPPAACGPSWASGRGPPLIGLLAQASDLGLRVIVTARAAGSAHEVMTAPLLRRLNDLQATTLMLSGNPPGQREDPGGTQVQQAAGGPRHAARRPK